MYVLAVLGYFIKRRTLLHAPMINRLNVKTPVTADLEPR